MSRQFILRLFAYTASALLLLLITLLGTLGYLLHSPQGTRWLFDQARELSPGELQVEKIHGSLTGPLEIDGLSYRDAGLVLEMDHFRLDWQPTRLLNLRLHLLDLTLQGTRLQLPRSETTSTEKSTGFNGIKLPLAIQLDSLLVEDFQLTLPDNSEPIRLERIALQAQAREDEVTINQLEAAAFSAQVNLAGSLRLSPDVTMNLQLDWLYQLAEGPQLAGQGTVEGSLVELQLQQSLAPPLEGELQATLFELTSAPRWLARLQLQEADIGVFAEGFPARINGELHSSGTPELIEARGNLNLSEPSLGELTAELQTRYTDGTLIAEQLLLTTPAGARVEGRGQYTLDNKQGKFIADLSWSELRWPLQGEAVQFRSKQGHLDIEGSPDDYLYRLELDAAQPDLPPAQLISSGSGNLDGLNLAELSVLLSEGRIQGNGQLAWAPELAWQANLSAEELNPGLFHAEFPGKLNLTMDSAGKIQNSTPQFDLRLQQLKGVLRDYPIKASGELHLEDKTLQIKSMQALSGENQMLLSGSAGEQLKLDWSINAPQLTALWPGLSGLLDASGTVAGSSQTPHIQANIDASQLAYQENRIGKLHAVTDINLGGDQQIALDLLADQLETADMAWQALQLNIGGIRNKHHIELDLQGQDVPQTTLVIDAGLSKEYLWSGTLQQLDLDLPKLAIWKLVRPSDFILGEQQQQLAQTCLGSASAEICSNFTGTAGEGWQANLQATKLPLKLLQQWLPMETQLTGQADLVAAFTADAQGLILGNANLTLPQGKLTFDLGDEPQAVDFSGGVAKAFLDPQGGRAELNIPLAGLGGIEGKMRLPGLQLPEVDPDKQPLGGRLIARIDDLSFISGISHKLHNVGGHIDADFILDGRLAEPRLMGNAVLDKGTLDIPEAGLELRELDLRMQATTLERLILEGSVKSGGGQLELKGETQLQSEQGFPTELRIKGQNWVAVDIPEAEVQVSPDLTINHNRDRSELNGEIVIPYARVRPREIPKSSVSGSSDLVVVGKDEPPQQRPDPKFHSKLRIIFGDRVSFKGMGLRAKLTGNLLVIDEPKRPVIGRGRVGVTEGTYQAYGQDLKIERGYALFADSPVDNPGLDVRAVREADDVTAGVRVTGTLKAPKLSLFSTPPMRETAVLSYLLTGRAPGASSGENMSLATALQATGAGSLTSEIGRRVGLEELRMDTGNSLEEASVVAGTYLSPRLYVQYVNELATRETKLRLRYDLTKRLQIQTESGTTQGVDLFYTIER